MSDYLKDLASKGCRILTDTKLPKQSIGKTKAVENKAAPVPPKDIHEATVKRCIKEKPHKKHLIEFFESVIEQEEAKL
jgi:hypothetical protein